MKIKCPICEKLGYDVRERKMHVIGYHKLIRKIHEKIESLENTEFENLTKGEWKINTMTREWTIRELKSLLENEK